MQNNLESWVTKKLGKQPITFTSLSGDASFRRYYRATQNNQTYIIMDAPPPQENLLAFIEISKQLQKANLTVPKIIAYDLKKGYAILSNFGDTLLQTVLNDENVDGYYQKAMQVLLTLSSYAPQQASYPLPTFDQKHLLLEFSYFQNWFLEQLLNLKITQTEEQMLEAVLQQFIENTLTQPQVMIHRDYHARNLMVLENNTLGIIDFQDAMIGPITYDLVSLLKDCYIAWPTKKIKTWLQNHHENLTQKESIKDISFQTFQHWFDLSGLQRHLKVFGIFARLYLRDNKARYLNDMPRILQYVLPILSQQAALSDFHDFFQAKITPKLKTFWQEKNIR